MNRRSLLLGTSTIAGLGLAGLSVGAARASNHAWPNREISLVNGFPAGAGTDLVTRAIAQDVEKRIKGTIVVKNVVGGGGSLGPAQVAQSAPDGYTMVLTGMASIIVLPRLQDLPYKPWESFDFIAGVAELRYGIGVRAESPIKSIDDLIAEGKKRRVTYSSNSPINIVAMFQLAKSTGANLRWVPFGGGAESVTQALGGHVDAVIQSVTEMKPHVESGKLRLLASASASRWSEFPDIRTLRELGHDAVSTSVMGYAFPRGVDPAIRQKMDDAYFAAMNDPAVQKAVTDLGMVPRPMRGPDFRAFLQAAEPALVQILRDADMLKKG